MFLTSKRQKTNMKNQRSFKIQPVIIPGRLYRDRKIYSVLTLRGKWLHDAGFLPYQQVNVTIEPDRIIIEKR